MNQPSSRTLEIAQGYIASPSTWCKGSRAQNRDGQECPVMSPSAVKFCTKGALFRALGSEEADITAFERFFVARQNSANPDSLHYVGFNELKTHEQVIAMWSEAIRLAKAEE